MISPDAINRFADRQKRLLRKTYDAAWATGVAAYQPNEDPATEPSTPRHLAVAGLTGAAAAAVLRHYRYEPPASPDPIRRAVSLAPSFVSVRKMTGELATWSPTTLTAATAIRDAQQAYAQALLDWVGSNGYRLDLGDSVAWAGEQAGFADAAFSDGVLLQWYTEGDNRVCSDCDVLGTYPPMIATDWPTMPASGDTECNVGCFAPGTLIGGRVEGGLRAFYDGPMVELKTRDGHRLTLTANHPVATTEGFVSAGAVREGQYVLACRPQVQVTVGSGAIPEPQKEQGPALVEDILRALTKTGVARKAGTRSEDLYGDARFLQGDVQVVWAKRALLDDRPRSPADQGRAVVFPSPAVNLAGLAGTGAFRPFRLRALPAPTRLPRRLQPDRFRTVRLDLLPLHQLRLGLATSLDPYGPQLDVRRPRTPSVGIADGVQGTVLMGGNQRRQRGRRRRGTAADGFRRRSHLTPHGFRVPLDHGPFQEFRFGPASKVDARLTEAAMEDPSADARFVGETLERFPGLVAPDEVVEVRHFHYSGHVYDLQSPQGWICADGILAANCRCSLEAVADVLPGDSYTPSLSAAQEDLIGSLASRQADALASLMPDAAYLD